MKFIVLFVAFVYVASGPGEQTAASPDVQSKDLVIGYDHKSKPCSCNGDQCSCCFDTPIIDERGCLNAKIVNGKILYDLGISKLALLSTTGPISANQRQCTTVKKPLDILSVCLNVTPVPIAFGTSSCPALQFFIEKKVVGTIFFQCIDVRGGGSMSTGGYINPSKPTPYYEIRASSANQLKQKIALVKSGKLKLQ